MSAALHKPPGWSECIPKVTILDFGGSDADALDEWPTYDKPLDCQTTSKKLCETHNEHDRFVKDDYFKKPITQDNSHF